MREIKFKAWLPGINKMTNTHTLDELMNWSTDKKHNSTAEWLQYTGLKDKDGKEIYEGDIVEQIGWEGEHYIVEFTDCAFYAKSIKRIVPPPWRTKYTKLDELMEFEVIGNIYESPELLDKD